MPTLAKKLIRTVKSSLGQFIAVVAVIAVGITVYVAMTATADSLILSRKTFYHQTDFADYFFHVVQAPESVLQRVESVPGVLRATVRIQKDVPVLGEGGRRSTLRLTGVPMPMEGELDRIEVLSGRLFDERPEGGAVEVLLTPQFAKARELSPGSTIDVAAEGRRKTLTVTGTASSPEFIYAIRDASGLLEDPSSFGAAMLPQRQLQQLLQMKGSVNQVLVLFSPGADRKLAIEDIKGILEPYGNLTGYPQKDQLSEAILRMELDQLKAFARFLPAIFLAVAALMQFVFLGRMVRAQRTQIGLFKALGYGRAALLALYGGYALLAALCGAAAGIASGYALASVMIKVYGAFFNLPRLEEALHHGTALIVAAASVAAGTLAGAWAARGVLAIEPAESMRPAPPGRGNRSFAEGWPFLWNRLGLFWRMSLRSMGRNRFRATVTTTGILFASAMLVISLFSRDSIQDLMDKHFGRDQKYDYLVRIVTPVNEAGLLNISRLDGVRRLEPVLELPLRIRFRGKSEEDVFTAVRPGTTLLGITGDDGRPREVPAQGVFLDRFTVQKLGVTVGDDIEVETLLSLGPPRTGRLRVAGITRRAVGSASVIHLAEANRLLREQHAVTGAMLSVDPGLADNVEAALADMVNLASVVSRRSEKAYLEENLGYMYYSIGILLVFSSILGFAIIYNASIMSFAERRRELASLRVLGFSVGEVSEFLLKENLPLLALGVLAGLPAGRLLAEGYAAAVSSDLFSFEVVLYGRTYLLAAMGGVFFVAVAWRLAVRAVRKLEFVDVLKARD